MYLGIWRSQFTVEGDDNAYTKTLMILHRRHNGSYSAKDVKWKGGDDGRYTEELHVQPVVEKYVDRVPDLGDPNWKKRYIGRG